MNTEGVKSSSRRRQELLQAMARSIDGAVSGREMANQVFLSRFHFQRVFRHTVGESPAALRRRLVLERAAYDLRTTARSVTAIALEAGYGSPEGFSRAFRRAYGLAPRSYRQAANQIRKLPGSSGVHYSPASGGQLFSLTGGHSTMDFTERLLETDYMMKRRVLECARLMSDGQLDAPLLFRHNLMPFVKPASTLRESMAYLTSSLWVDMMFDRVGLPPEDDRYRNIQGNSADEMIERFEGYHRALRTFMSTVQERNLWDQEWVDDACEPPETFAIGMVLQAQITWEIAYRMILERMMEQNGFRLREIAVHAPATPALMH